MYDNTSTTNNGFFFFHFTLGSVVLSCLSKLQQGIFPPTDHVNFVPQHHHDHIFHSAGARSDAAVSVDLQPGLDQHTCRQPHALRGHHTDPVQHSHPHRVRGSAQVPLHAPGRHCLEGNFENILFLILFKLRWTVQRLSRRSGSRLESAFAQNRTAYFSSCQLMMMAVTSAAQCQEALLPLLLTKAS